MKRIYPWVIVATLALTLVGCSHPASITGSCTLTEDRTATLSVADAKGVNIKGQTGSVKVVGRPGLAEIQVKGTACATSESALKAIKLTTERSSDGWARVLVDMPRGSNKIDMTVEVPENLQLMARNDTGTLEVSHVVQGANVRADNGTLTITDVKGGVTAESRNGAVAITRVEGNVGVTRADNGLLTVTDVKGDVRVTKKTGAVVVTNVTGNLTLTQKVSGLVTHSDISGKVTVPR